jgi:hypothetical protein
MIAYKENDQGFSVSINIAQWRIILTRMTELNTHAIH